MKLYEIAGDKFLSNTMEIKDWLKQQGLAGGRIHSAVTPDGTNLYAANLEIGIGHRASTFGKPHLPVKFDNILCNKFVLSAPIRSLEGMPNTLDGDLEFNDMLFDDLKFLPKEITGHLKFHNCLFSLKGVEDHIDRVRSLTLSYCEITGGGLGLILAKHLNANNVQIKSRVTYGTQEESPSTRALEIIAKYLGKLDSLFDCQTELISAGLDKYAEL